MANHTVWYAAWCIVHFGREIKEDAIELIDKLIKVEPDAVWANCDLGGQSCIRCNATLGAFGFEAGNPRDGKPMLMCGDCHAVAGVGGEGLLCLWDDRCGLN